MSKVLPFKHLFAFIIISLFVLLSAINQSFADSFKMEDTIMINSPSAIQGDPLAAVISSVNRSCFGADDGSITISSPLGGSGSYQFSIDGIAWTSVSVFTNLPAGTYQVMMRDAANTTDVTILNSSLIISEPSKLNASVTTTDVSTCNGAATASISIYNPAGGSGLYGYSINGGVTWVSQANFNSLNAGSYNVMMRDETFPNCSVTLNGQAILTDPAVLIADVSSTDATGCHGSADGNITIVSQTGGSGNYEYTINGGVTWTVANIFSNLSAGSYDVKIRDAAFPTCIISLNSSLLINEPAELNAVLNHSDVTSCYGNTNGSISIAAPVGGSGAYQYSLDGGANWASLGNFTNLAAGTYNVQIRDSKYFPCVKVLNSNLSISQPAPLSATVTYSDNTSCAGNDSRITISEPGGGSGPYLYTIESIAPFQSSPQFMGMPAGNYQVRMKDANNPPCVTLLKTVTILSPNPLSATVTSSNVIVCYGTSNGSIFVSASQGGSGNYQYSIDGGLSWPGTGTSFNFSNLAAGSYNVQMRDESNPACFTVLYNNLIITQPLQLNATVTSFNTNCGENNGSISVNASSGGTGVYEYSYDSGFTWRSNAVLSELEAGTYTVFLRDAANFTCMRLLGEQIITASSGPSIQSVNVTAACSGKKNGTASAFVNGGTLPYAYTWKGITDSTLSATADTLAAGNYVLKIRDGLGCSATKTFTIPEKKCGSINIGSTIPFVCDTSTISLSYALDTVYSAGRPLKVLLSDPQGNFTPGRFIDSALVTQSGSIVITFHNIPAGKKYRLQLIASSPADTSLPGNEFEIGNKPEMPTLNGEDMTCVGSSIYYTAQAEKAMTYIWYDAMGQEVQGVNVNYFWQNVEDALRHTIKVAAINACGAGPMASKEYSGIPVPVYPLLHSEGIQLICTEANSYQWSFNGEIISGATSRTLLALQSGFYTVTANPELCSAEDSLYFSGIVFNQDQGVLQVPQVNRASYEWYFENQLIGGANTNTYAPTNPGTYKTVITFDQSNQRTSATMQAVYEFYFDGVITGTNEVLQAGLQLFPNPGNGVIQLRSSIDMNGMQACLYNLAGQLVAMQTLTSGGTMCELNFKEAGIGVYYLQLKGNNTSIIRKIVVE